MSDLVKYPLKYIPLPLNNKGFEVIRIGIIPPPPKAFEEAWGHVMSELGVPDDPVIVEESNGS